MLSLFFRRGSRSASSSDTGSARKNDKSTMSAEGSTEFHSCGPILPALGLNNSLSCIAGLPETRRLVITQALNHLFSEQYFSVCKLDDIMKIVNAPNHSEAYRLLRTLHCVHYSTMNPALRDRLPQLINECLQPPMVECVATMTALQGIEL